MKPRLSAAVLAVLLAATAGYAMSAAQQAQQAQERYETLMERAETEYAAAVERATERYVRELNQALQGAVRAGNEEDAAEIRAELETLEVKSFARGGDRLAPEDVVGGWIRIEDNGHLMRFAHYPDGSVRAIGAQSDSREWEIIGNRWVLNGRRVFEPVRCIKLVEITNDSQFVLVPDR